MRPPKTQIPTPLGTQPPPHRLLHWFPDGRILQQC